VFEQSAIECLGFDLMTIPIKRYAMIVIGALCEYSNLASFKLDAIALVIEPFWNMNFEVFMLSFEFLSNMLMIETFYLAY
jgi:hypothetical protein